jgi:hypothetical protein
VPECTALERALLDKVVRGEFSGEESSELTRVLLERLTPELKERAIQVHVAYERATKARSAVWEELRKLGFSGERSHFLWSEIAREAKSRMGEPAEEVKDA